MTLVDFGRRLQLNNMTFPDYLHNHMPETVILYDLLGQNAPASIGVNICDTGGIEYIIIGIDAKLKEYIQAALTVPVVMAYGRNILVKTSVKNDRYTISMIDTDII